MHQVGQPTHSLDDPDTNSNSSGVTRRSACIQAVRVIALALLASTACAAETQETSAQPPGPPATSPYESAQVRTPETTTTTTTTLPPTVRTFDLPIVANSDGDPEAIKVLQRLVTAICCPLVDDGVWGPKTDESVQEAREIFGLGPGGLDVALWEAVFTLEQPDTYSTVESERHGLPLPNTAVLITSGTQSRYVLAANTRGGQLWTWYRDNHANRPLPDWKSCLSSGGPLDFAVSWWRPLAGGNGTKVTLNVVDDGLGRFDLFVTETASRGAGCAGYEPPAPTSTTTDPPTPNTSGSTGSGSSGSGSTGISGCYAGMNVETCEDLLGLSAGQRFRSRDCTGNSRDIWIARNWWIIGFWNGIPIVSKHPSKCE